MKDITIKGVCIKRELWIFLGVFIFAFGLNIYSILHYKTSWSELYTHLYIVLLMTIFIYCVIAGIRLVVALIYRLFRKKATV